MSCPVVIHPDRANLLPRPKSVAARFRRGRHAGEGISPVRASSRESSHPLPEWRVGFEQQSRNLQHHIHQSKQGAASTQDFEREDTGNSSKHSVRTFQSWGSMVEGELILAAVANVVQREFNIMRDWILEKNADQKIWFESAFSEIEALQLRVLDGLQDVSVTRSTNQETQLTPILRGTARSEPVSVAAQRIGKAQAFQEILVSPQCRDEANTVSGTQVAGSARQQLCASEEDREVDTAPSQSMLSPLDVDSTGAATDGLQIDETKAFNRISTMVTSLQKKKGIGSDLQHALGLTLQDNMRVREAHGSSHMPDQPPNRCLAAFVRGGLFTGIVGWAVILNSFLIGIDVNDDMRRALHNEGEQDPIFETMNTCFTIFFTFELILRVIGLRTWFILGHDRGWNIFDTVLVALSLIDLIAGERSGNLFFMRVVKIFRMARVLRVFLVLRVFRELRRMMMSVLASLQALMWALILLLLLIYVFSVVFMRAGADYLSESGTPADRRLWKHFYGSIKTSMYMLLQCISGGQDWGPMVEPLEMLSGVYKILYVLFISFIVFGLLNVLTGVFIGTAGEFMDRDFITQAEIFKERRFEREMKMLIYKLGDDKSGEITWHQFCSLTGRPEMQAFLAANGLSTIDQHLLFGLCAGSMDAQTMRTEDFVTGCHCLKGPANQLQVQASIIELELIHSSLHASFTNVLKYLRAADYANRQILTKLA